MTDFFQNGVIMTLQDLKDRPVEELEAQIRKYADQQKIALILPALYSEFETPAMPRIIEELRGADYLHRIILSLDRADPDQFRRAHEALSVLPVEVKILWHSGPRMHALYEELRASDFEIPSGGKGRGVWMSIGHCLTDKSIETIALHDCDIVGYERKLLARLLLPIVHPGTDLEFCKGFYARANGRLYGRVTRLFVTPMIRALKHLNGSTRFLEYLDSFRYPLAGEFAFIRSLAKGLRVDPGWGLEISMLREVFANTTTQRVCQIGIVDSYQHKHQELSAGDPSKGLVRMAAEIGKVLLRSMAESGLVLGQSFFDALLVAYEMHTRRAIEQYNAVAVFNGLDYSRHEEIEAAEAFVDALKIAIEEYLANPVGEPPLVAWVRVRAAIPDFLRRLEEAVRLDNEDVAREAAGAGA
ncbi:MAG: glycosyl transferase [Planctomycetota bacterium]|nr:glycosyl transferase [Planctomycetota bacterium]